ncbi:hypothetical protein TVAG_114830 [Trichomonas vaginalis G3]|uniref:Choline transporter-like protein n=1 Tax=Trichomonas vaginalis (strain ATCC PRA-98 / G3) TaxID=412133 RepID=A2FGK6_TRIV3|nr:choline transporter-like (SLC family 44) family [Trichomonas vaginalis G3]EAX95972.1 hypothetical protein TVAG_114830 [Trichomonas vaginalis G3]KAI5540470.1 choline transporter-like (SLC family 44) family [Trichomonas vaginalis G3]|eukprot:XP_001308902.1 hypothetical protein [Trichomonas vaginalis G3]
MSEEKGLPSNYETPLQVDDAVTAYPQADNPYYEHDGVDQVQNADNADQHDPAAANAQDYKYHEYKNTDSSLMQGLTSASTKSDYDLYSDMTYGDDPLSWMIMSNDPDKYVGFWNTPDSLRNFNDSSRQLKQLNSKWWAIPFLLNLFILFVINCCSWKKQAFAKIPVTIFICFVFVLLIILYNVSEQFLPVLSAKYGIIVSLCIHFILYICKVKFNWPWIFLIFFFVFLGYIVLVFTHGRAEYDASMVKLINSGVILKPFYIIFILASLTIMSIITVFTLYTAWSVDWNSYGFFQFYLIVSFYSIVCVFGNCFYMITSYLSAKLYLTGAQPTQQDLLHACRRAFYDNFGVACKLALILPFVEPLHAVARFDPAPMTADYPVSLKQFADLHQTVARTVIKISRQLARIIIKPLGYPNRRALVYSAVYGIEYNEACKRYAEICATRGANLVDEAYKYDAQLAFKQFHLGIALTYILPAIGPALSFHGLAYARGLFLLFALYFTLRTIMRSYLETVFVMFGELPENANNVRDNLRDELIGMYQNCARSINNAYDRDAGILTGLNSQKYSQ